jgi:hypothetical protein
LIVVCGDAFVVSDGACFVTVDFVVFANDAPVVFDN